MNQVRFGLVILVLAILSCRVSVGENPASVAIATTEESPTLISNTPARASVTAVQSLNVRQRAGEDQKVIGALYAGDDVILTGECSDGWAEIIWAESVAWVNADFISDNLCKEE